MKKVIVLIVFLLNGYLLIAQTNSSRYFVFKKSMEISQKDLSNFKQKHDSLIDSEYPLE
ncbi:hypothetical protein ACXIHB_10035 [Tenacibaculum sp. IMCC1]|uniref:GLPGLI family protein n=1 Tax=Tenacibaculum sp. Pbs-1 TaxID=3238748 RepID=A0AB33KZJ2_9FLAO